MFVRHKQMRENVCDNIQINILRIKLTFKGWRSSLVGTGNLDPNESLRSVQEIGMWKKSETVLSTKMSSEAYTLGWLVREKTKR